MMKQQCCRIVLGRGLSDKINVLSRSFIVSDESRSFKFKTEGDNGHFYLTGAFVLTGEIVRSTTFFTGSFDS